MTGADPMPRGRPRTGRMRPCVVCGTASWHPRFRLKFTCGLACRDELKRAEKYDDARKLKLCAACDEWRPYSEYAPARGSKAGTNALQAYCTPCAVIRNQKWRKNNPGKARAIAKKSQANNAGKGAERWRNLTREERDRKNALGREWRKANRHRTAEWNKRRMHRLRAGGELPPSEWFAWLLCAQDGRCPYCDGLLESYHLEHKTPVSRGGDNAAGNMQLTCGPCNLKKNTKTHEEYQAHLQTTTSGWKQPWWQHVL